MSDICSLGRRPREPERRTPGQRDVFSIIFRLAGECLTFLLRCTEPVVLVPRQLYQVPEDCSVGHSPPSRKHRRLGRAQGRLRNRST